MTLEGIWQNIKMYNIITIGSSGIDVFVKAKEETKKHKNHLDICYHKGEKMLIDKLEFTTGGGGSNTAVAFSRLGLRTGFIGVVGSDANGEIILNELDRERVDFLGVVRDGNSGFSVILAGDSDRTILTHKGVNDSLKFEDIYITQLKTHWFYLSSMLGDSLETIKKLAVYAHEHKIKVACNISLYLAKKGSKSLASFLKNIDVLIVNKDECFALVKRNYIEDSIKELCRYVKESVIVTDGFNPIYAYDGKRIYKKKIKKVKPVDTTGAGDAFASGFIYGIIKGKEIENCIEYGHKEALAVLGHIGAKNNLLSEL